MLGLTTYREEDDFAMNGGVQPVIELAGTNNAYPYPVMPAYGNNNGGIFGGADSGIWGIILLALLFGNGWGGNGGFGGFGGGAFNNEYAWLSNGQKEIMSNTNTGFDTLHLSNQIEGIRDGVYGISNQMCNNTASITQAVNSGFSNAEIAANSRQIADMNQNFNNQMANLQAFNSLGSQLASCCCENRLATANLTSTVLSENCADRAALSDALRDVITNQTANTQRILDQLCNDKIDAKNEKIADLERQLNMADLRASQIAQTAQIREGQVQEIDAMYQRLKDCPVGTVPVYGNQAIFSCPNNGCGCGGNFI